MESIEICCECGGKIVAKCSECDCEILVKQLIKESILAELNDLMNRSTAPGIIDDCYVEAKIKKWEGEK